MGCSHKNTPGECPICDTMARLEADLAAAVKRAEEAEAISAGRRKALSERDGDVLKWSTRAESAEARESQWIDKHHELQSRFNAAEARAARFEAALIRLRDCDWTITLPDRMDAVRDIARAALTEGDARA